MVIIYRTTQTPIAKLDQIGCRLAVPNFYPACARQLTLRLKQACVARHDPATMSLPTAAHTGYGSRFRASRAARAVRLSTQHRVYHAQVAVHCSTLEAACAHFVLPLPAGPDLFLQGRTRAVPLMADAPRDPQTGKVTSYLALGLTAGIKLKTLEQHAATCSAALEDVDSQEEEAPAATIFTLTTACVFSERLLE